MSNEDKESMALLRYQVISPFLAEDPPRGQRYKMIERLADKEWPLADGTGRRFSAETIRRWIRLYKSGGFEGLQDKTRSDVGSTIPPELIEEACRLKKEVPERGIEQIIHIMETMGGCAKGLLKRSTLHRDLQKRGLSGRPKALLQDTQDLSRFAATHANDLSQADMLVGPWLADPERPGKMRRAYLYAFIDDASRLVTAGLFFFKGDLPSLELVMKRSIQRYGRPTKVYYDNGMVFRSRKMKHICAALGVHRLIFTTPYRPQGHGKIEAFNRFCRGRFVAEVKASSIETLEQLNQAFLVWLDRDYNRRVHTELGTSPHQRWMEDTDRIRYVDEKKLHRAFLFQVDRTPDKCGVFSLHGRSYQVDYELAKKKIQVHYDAENLEQVEVFRNGLFKERAQFLQVQPCRPRKKKADESDEKIQGPVTDYLGFLARQHREERNGPVAESPEPFIAMVKDLLDERVFDESLVRKHWERFGPFDLDRVARRLAELLEVHPSTHHVDFYLDKLRPEGEPS
jgi:transposase InsO family protein